MGAITHTLTDSRGLNPKRAAFVAEYPKDKNGKQAAIRAGYSPRSAEVTASRLLRDAKVKAAIEAELNKLCGTAMTAAHVTTERLLREYARLGFSDIRKLYDDKGNIKPIQELDDDTAAAISSVEEEVEIELAMSKNDDGTDGALQKIPVRVRKVKFADKRGALDSMADHLGMFQKGRGAVPQTVILNINLGTQQIAVRNGGSGT